ncbi:Bug family tripartite tricarboxylate transporter substrate binding protein [Roseococcus pinisoli]|uniref:Tripartite tricarboxylate transporter substrate binding protein n=1 Tax=Roseococcus pinisoli TaxID=2835040 RepID=A0ABS5QDG6_9PROT|nr:tripartite tricarboxylate transporter substrate binding protein [Roseococcus pinisoli]MBS7811301.1 tripartite tricarboxylate transporter substrate binding protein [Roseococcus pinisoli]
MNRRQFLAAPAATALATPALAQSERPIRLVVPVAAGGSQDVVGRLVARHLGPLLGTQIVVENHPGAGSNIGYELVARSRADGLTLLGGSDSLSINKSLFRRLSFDPVEDFAPIAQATSVPQILVVRADFPATTFAQFVELSRNAPTAIGTPGNGSLSHLLTELAKQATETNWTHAPYRGGALAVNDLLGGSLQGVMINIGAVAQHVQAGRLRGLAVSTGSRTQALPEVPTLIEAGLSGVDVAGWHGIVAPKGTPTEIVTRINQAVSQVLAQAEVRERLSALGIDPVIADANALAVKIREDAERWAPVIQRIGMQAD